MIIYTITSSGHALKRPSIIISHRGFLSDSCSTSEVVSCKFSKISYTINFDRDAWSIHSIYEFRWMWILLHIF